MSNFFKGLSKSDIVTLVGTLVILIVFSAFATDVDRIPPEKQSVLQGMRDAGFSFDSTLVKVDGEVSKTQATVSGPMTGPKVIPAPGEKTPRKEFDAHSKISNFQPYSSVTLKWDEKDSKWFVVSGVFDKKYVNEKYVKNNM